MKKNIIFGMIIILFVFVIFASGCKKGEQQTIEKPFIGGTDGVLISFMEGFPPDKVYDMGQNPFNIDVQLRNNGEWEVPKDKIRVTIKGISPTDFGKTASDFVKNPNEDLLKKRITSGTIVDGTTTHIIFSGLNYKGEVAGDTHLTIRAEECYDYGTTATTLLCIKKNLLEEGGVCSPNEQKTIFSSSAPLQITNFIESPAGKGKIQFVFTISHVGTGAVYKEGSWCDDNILNQNKVYVNVDTGIGNGAYCGTLIGGSGHDGEITLYNGEATIMCTQDISTESDYEKPIMITLKYAYKDHVTTDLTVSHLS